jgi:hypothetical protein
VETLKNTARVKKWKSKGYVEYSNESFEEESQKPVYTQASDKDDQIPSDYQQP